MSLIDEALKRARQEAARQDEAAREIRYKQVPVIPGLRAPARRPWLLPVVIAALLALGIGIGFGLSLFRSGGEEQRATVVPPVESPVRSEPPPAPAESVPAPAVPEAKPALLPTPPPVVVEEKPAPPVVEEKRPEEDPAITDMRQREIALSPARATEPPAPPAQAEPEPAPATPAPQPAAPAPTSEPGQVKTYQQELPLAGGGMLRLNGIAYSDQQPVALFGDKVVAPGESVAGYKVVSIEVGRVKLEGPGGVVVVEMQ
ncbi:MAG TPA: hypothetical protein VEW48_21500 [Thermoanaerobaculia bacterium]|nr:hypothetical protein [Thermoanaerobaculia bacterium]